MASPERGLHARRTAWLDADDAGPREASAHPGEAAGKQAAATDRNQQHVRSLAVKLLDDLAGHGPLACDGGQRVEGVYLNRAGSFGLLSGRRCSLIVGIANKDQFDPFATDLVHAVALLPRGRRRTENPSLDAQLRA